MWFIPNKTSLFNKLNLTKDLWFFKEKEIQVIGNRYSFMKDCEYSSLNYKYPFFKYYNLYLFDKWSNPYDQYICMTKGWKYISKEDFMQAYEDYSNKCWQVSYTNLNNAHIDFTYRDLFTLKRFEDIQLSTNVENYFYKCETNKNKNQFILNMNNEKYSWLLNSTIILLSPKKEYWILFIWFENKEELPINDIKKQTDLFFCCFNVHTKYFHKSFLEKSNQKLLSFYNNNYDPTKQHFVFNKIPKQLQYLNSEGRIILNYQLKIYKETSLINVNNEDHFFHILFSTDIDWTTLNPYIIPLDKWPYHQILNWVKTNNPNDKYLEKYISSLNKKGYISIEEVLKDWCILSYAVKLIDLLYDQTFYHHYNIFPINNIKKYKDYCDPQLNNNIALKKYFFYSFKNKKLFAYQKDNEVIITNDWLEQWTIYNSYIWIQPINYYLNVSQNHFPDNNKYYALIPFENNPLNNENKTEVFLKNIDIYNSLDNGVFMLHKNPFNIILPFWHTMINFVLTKTMWKNNDNWYEFWYEYFSWIKELTQSLPLKTHKHIINSLWYNDSSNKHNINIVSQLDLYKSSEKILFNYSYFSYSQEKIMKLYTSSKSINSNVLLSHFSTPLYLNKNDVIKESWLRLTKIIRISPYLNWYFLENDFWFIDTIHLTTNKNNKVRTWTIIAEAHLNQKSKRWLFLKYKLN